MAWAGASGREPAPRADPAAVGIGMTGQDTPVPALVGPGEVSTEQSAQVAAHFAARMEASLSEEALQQFAEYGTYPSDVPRRMLIEAHDMLVWLWPYWTTVGREHVLKTLNDMTNERGPLEVYLEWGWDDEMWDPNQWEVRVWSQASRPTRERMWATGRTPATFIEINHDWILVSTSPDGSSGWRVALSNQQ